MEFSFTVSDEAFSTIMICVGILVLLAVCIRMFTSYNDKEAKFLWGFLILYDLLAIFLAVNHFCHFTTFGGFLTFEGK